VSASSPNLIDRLVAFLSPRAGLDRLRARVGVDLALRHFEGAATSRRTQYWVAPASGPNTALIPAIRMMRNRARDLGRNNPWARRAIRVIKANTVGGGIRLRPKADSEAQVQAARDAWARWAETTECDADGRHDFYGIQGLCLRTMAEAGEVLIRRRRRRSRDGLTVPIQLQVLEPDHMDSRRDYFDLQGNKVLQGIKFDSLGRRVGYYLFPAHPGETLRGPISYVSEFVPAEDVIHIYEADRPGQVRGIPWGMSIMIKLKDLDDYEDASLVKQKSAAAFAGFIQDSEYAEDLPPQTADGRDPVDVIEPGTIQRLPPGTEINFAKPPSTGDYREFTAAQQRAIAAGFGITYESLTGDYSASNFSSSRMGWLEMQRNVRDWQDLMICQVCNPVYSWFAEAALFAGIDVADVRAGWTPPRREMIDPAAEVQAQKNAIRSGLTTLPEVLREQGWEPEEALDEMAEAWEDVDERGLVLDCDPRRTSGQGQLEGAPGAGAAVGAAVAGAAPATPPAAPEQDEPEPDDAVEAE
jgi:lambda family phage portal protein